MALTAMAKLLGMLRAAHLAACLGTGSAANALAVANRIPSLLFDLLLGAAIPGYLIPQYGKAGRDKKGVTISVFTGVLGITTLLTVIGIVLADPLLACLSPGLPKETADLAVSLLPICLPTLIPMGCTAVLTALCQTKERYLFPAIAGITANGIALLALNIIPAQTPRGIAAIWLIAWMIQPLVLIWPFRSMTLPHQKPDLSILTEMGKQYPAAVTSSLLLPLSFATAIAISSYHRGGTASLDYAALLFSAVLGITVSGIVNYSFPKLASARQKAERRNRASACLAGLLILSFPLALFLCLLSPELIALLYYRGNFDQTDVATVSSLFSVLALALPLCTIEEFFYRLALTAEIPKATYLPTLAGGILSLFLPLFWHPTGQQDAAIAFCLTHLITTLLQGFLLRKELHLSCLRILPIILMGLSCFCGVYALIHYWLPISLPAQNLLFPILVALFGGGLYQIVCRGLLSRERRAILYESTNR